MRYQLQDIPEDAPEAASSWPEDPPYTAAIYDTWPDVDAQGGAVLPLRWVFRFRADGLKPASSGKSHAEEVLLRLNHPGGS